MQGEVFIFPFFPELYFKACIFYFTLINTKEGNDKFYGNDPLRKTLSPATFVFPVSSRLRTHVTYMELPFK